MSKFLEQLGRLVAENEDLQNLILGAKRDIKGVVTAPGRALGAGAKMVGRGIENVADFAEDAAGFVAENAPRLEIGSGGSEIEINPLGALARGAEAYADNVSTLGGAVADSDLIDDLSGQSAIDRMDRRIENISSDGLSQRDRFLQRKAQLEAQAAERGERSPYKRKQDSDEFNPPSFSDLSPAEQEAHRKRRAERRGKLTGDYRDPERRKRIAKMQEDFGRRVAERAGGGEESFEDFDPTGEEYDSAFDGSADSQGRSAYAPSETEPKRGTQRVASKPDSGPMDTGGLDPDDPTTFGGPLAAQGSEPDPPKAVPVAPDDQAEALFKVVHGGPFDPNSSMDRGKLAKIKENLVREEYQGLTPNQFALKMYREAA